AVDGRAGNFVVHREGGHCHQRGERCDDGDLGLGHGRSPVRGRGTFMSAGRLIPTSPATPITRRQTAPTGARAKSHTACVASGAWRKIFSRLGGKIRRGGGAAGAYFKTAPTAPHLSR